MKKMKNMSQDAKHIFNLLRELSYRYDLVRVWQDFILLFACAISNAVDKKHFAERERLYKKTIERYNEQEQSIFPQIAAEIIMALEKNPEQDCLGKLYMEMEISNKHAGQYFTPYSVSKMMAAMTTIDVIDTVRKNGYATLNDPTCGAGAMLIASLHEAGEKLKKEEMNWQNHLLVSGQDIDYTAALMCYIQLSLLGAAGFVKIGDSLTSPIAGMDSPEDCWFTPMYFSDVWALRRVISLAKAN